VRFSLSIASHTQIQIGKRQQLPLREQLFDHEWEALQELKRRHPKVRGRFVEVFIIYSV
jgi:hypothetical protein